MSKDKYKTTLTYHWIKRTSWFRISFAWLTDASNHWCFIGHTTPSSPWALRAHLIGLLYTHGRQEVPRSEHQHDVLTRRPRRGFWRKPAIKGSVRPGNGMERDWFTRESLGGYRATDATSRWLPLLLGGCRRLVEQQYLWGREILSITSKYEEQMGG